jgi:choline-sulfatase
MSDQGYDTLAVLSNPHLTEGRNFDIGFDKFQNIRSDINEKKFSEEDKKSNSNIQLGDMLWKLRERMQNKDRLRIVSPYAHMFSSYRSIQKFKRWPTISAQEVISELWNTIDDMDGPFFAWSHLMDLHAPLNPESVKQGDLLENDSSYRQYIYDARRAANIQENRYNLMYDSTLRYIDQWIGKLVEYLKDSGYWENTIIILTSDHGEALHEKGVYGHVSLGEEFAHNEPRHYLYDELLHVPLIIRIPNKDGSRVQRQFSLAWINEILEEILREDFASFPAETGVSHLDGNEDLETPIYSDSITENGHTVAVRNQEYKYTKMDHVGEMSDDGIGSYLSNGVETKLRSISQIPTELTEFTETHFCEPSSLSVVSAELDEDVDDLLKQLGYKN